jgi:hypothetical protein
MMTVETRKRRTFGNPSWAMMKKGAAKIAAV